jgi:hypothetical protein
VHGKEDHPRPRTHSEDLAGRVEAVQDRHREIQDRHVRAAIASQADGLLAVRGFADDLEPLSLHQDLEALADDQVVIG